MRRLTPNLALAALLAPALIAIAPAAHAHAVLIDSTPAPNGHVPAGALAIVFRYNSKIDVSRSKLTLTAPDGSQTRLPATDGPAPALMVANTTVQPGAYTLRWQVLAVDGHITRGSVPFTVTPGGVPSTVTPGGVPSAVTPGGVPSAVTPGGVPSAVTPGGVPSTVDGK